MTNEALANELLRCEKQFWQALMEQDVEKAIELTDFPCVLTGAQGIGEVDRATFTKMMKNPPYVIHDFQIDRAPVVRELGDDIAVIAYKVREDITVDGERIALDAADSSTWIRRDGKWRCALHTEAITGDPFGRDRTTS